MKIGDVVKVKVIGIDEKGRTNLSLKAMQPKPEFNSSDNHQPKEKFFGRERRKRF